jgi:hypothetical protein
MAASTAFYDAVLAPVGGRRILDVYWHMIRTRRRTR